MLTSKTWVWIKLQFPTGSVLHLICAPQGANTACAYAGDALKASFAHNIDAYQSYGAEVYKNAHSEDVNFLLGYSKRLRDGALTKVKVQNNGNVTLLYEAVSNTPCASLPRAIHFFVQTCICLMPVCSIHVVFAEYVSEVLHMISSHDLGNDKTSAA